MSASDFGLRRIIPSIYSAGESFDWIESAELRVSDLNQELPLTVANHSAQRQHLSEQRVLAMSRLAVVASRNVEPGALIFKTQISIEKR